MARYGGSVEDAARLRGYPTRLRAFELPAAGGGRSIEVAIGEDGRALCGKGWAVVGGHACVVGWAADRTLGRSVPEGLFGTGGTATSC